MHIQRTVKFIQIENFSLAICFFIKCDISLPFGVGSYRRYLFFVCFFFCLFLNWRVLLSTPGSFICYHFICLNTGLPHTSLTSLFRRRAETCRSHGGCKLQAAGCRSRVAGRRLQVAGCNLRLAARLRRRQSKSS